MFLTAYRANSSGPSDACAHSTTAGSGQCRAPMKQPLHSMLSRREREIMDVLYRTGIASAHEIRKALSASPTHSTVRTQLRVLEHKGYIRREPERVPQLFRPVVPRHVAGTQELGRLVRTFFSHSAHAVVAALLSGAAGQLSDEELVNIARIVGRLRKRGRVAAVAKQSSR